MVHCKAVLRTDLGAITALYALERDDVPGSIILVDGDAVSRTALLAHAAENAVIGIEHDVTLQALGLRLRLERVLHGLGLLEQGPERHLS